MTFDIVPNLTTWSTFWQFDWHIENLIDILTIWLTFWQLGWHFDILFVSRQIWKDLVKSSSSKNHIFTLGHFGRHLDLTQIETAQSGRLHVYNNEEHVETLWRGRWQQWRTGGNSSIRKMTGTARWEPKAFLLQLNRVSRNLKRKGKKKSFQISAIKLLRSRLWLIVCTCDIFCLTIFIHTLRPTSLCNVYSCRQKDSAPEVEWKQTLF